jgi:DNA (cytosine-5)-methyltransferase 1
MTWGFPCQDISIAGKLKGIKEGKTRSGLYYEGYRILKTKKPKISIIEI